MSKVEYLETHYGNTARFNFQPIIHLIQRARTTQAALKKLYYRKIHTQQMILETEYLLKELLIRLPVTFYCMQVQLVLVQPT